MSKIILITILGAVIGVAPVISSNPPNTGQFNGENLPQSLTFVGTVEGKSYFADNTTDISWFEAKEFCESMRMTLASIESQAQSQFLNSSYNADYFNKIYWIAGRDSLTPDQFSWDNSEKPLDDSYLPAIQFFVDTQSCLMFDIRSHSGKIYVFPCTYTTPNVATLCQV